jgi:hypothetical protein
VLRNSSHLVWSLRLGLRLIFRNRQGLTLKKGRFQNWGNYLDLPLTGAEIG